MFRCFDLNEEFSNFVNENKLFTNFDVESWRSGDSMHRKLSFKTPKNKNAVENL